MGGLQQDGEGAMGGLQQTDDRQMDDSAEMRGERRFGLAPKKTSRLPAFLLSRSR
jgi:hypothetical protein